MPINLKTELDNLKYVDAYSFIFFALYKLNETEKYSTLSELPYLLDRDSLFNLLECYGGMTITIPTKKELENIIHALLVFYAVRFENKDFKYAISTLDIEKQDMSSVVSIYTKLSELLENYDFRRN